MQSIGSLELRERPREKLCAAGPEQLSDLELVALLLGSGTRGVDVLALAGRVLGVIDRSGDGVTAEGLCEIAGVGPAKASLIVAALEFARRRIRPRGVKIKEAGDIFALVRHLADRKQEAFIVISLNGAHEVIASRIVTVGLVNSTQVHPREVFADPITDRAAAVAVAHNHPSGELLASKEDELVTRVLVDAGRILGIRLLDHVIFSERGFVSLRELGVV